MFKTKWWLIPCCYLLAIWIMFTMEQRFNIQATLALVPRDRAHLMGILTTVFIHSDLLHIASNSLPLMICLLGLFYFYRDISINVLLICHITTGVFIWLFARPAYHIGASGLVYALVLFLLTSGFIRRNKRLKFLALAVLSIQSGLIWGVVPQGNNISWESHLFGAIVGIVAAFAFRNKGPLPDQKFHWGEEDNPYSQDHPIDEYERFGE